uniref:Uncharacterized protein n=1 Tax=Ixodes ricinus TaxID=34613 RepID=A0A6B0TXK9_IXORI
MSQTHPNICALLFTRSIGIRTVFAASTHRPGRVPWLSVKSNLRSSRSRCFRTPDIGKVGSVAGSICSAATARCGRCPT